MCSCSGVLYSQIRSSATPFIITRALLRHVVFSRALFHSVLYSVAHSYTTPYILTHILLWRLVFTSVRLREEITRVLSVRVVCFLSGILCLFYSGRCFLIRVLFWRVVLNDLPYFHAFSLLVTFLSLFLGRSSC